MAGASRPDQVYARRFPAQQLRRRSEGSPLPAPPAIKRKGGQHLQRGAQRKPATLVALESLMKRTRPRPLKLLQPVRQGLNARAASSRAHGNAAGLDGGGGSPPRSAQNGIVKKSSV